MESAGIDISMFTPHSTRMAATSKAKAASILIQEILRTAGWSSSGTFDGFYDKPLMEESTFASAVLNNDLRFRSTSVRHGLYTLSVYRYQFVYADEAIPGIWATCSC